MTKRDRQSGGDAVVSQEAVNQAVALHRGGQLAEAVRRYRLILATTPNQLEVLFNLGMLEAQRGAFDESIRLIGRILAINPDSLDALMARGSLLAGLNRYDEALVDYDRVVTLAPENAAAWFNHGNLRRLLKHYEEALVSYERSLAQAPLDIDVLTNRGITLDELKRYDEALASYERALEIKPDFVEALNNRANLLLRLKRAAAALADGDRAIAIKPEYAEAHNNRGNALFELERYDEAVLSFDRALAIAPSFCEALCNRGNVLRTLGRFDEALASFDQALSIDPMFAAAWSNRGNVLRELGQLDAALVSCDQALAGVPDFVEALSARGSILLELTRADEALTVYDRALSLKPDFAEAYANRGNALFDLGRIEEAAQSYESALAIEPHNVNAYDNLLYLHAFARDVPPEEERDLAAGWEMVALNAGERATAQSIRLSLNGFAQSRAGRKLRVGVLSAEIGQHPVAEFLEPFMEQLDRDRFQLALYQTVVRPEARAVRLRALADDCKSVVGLSDITAVNLIRADKIDILIDTTGHMRSSRLGILAHRAAPVQCHYIGYHGPTGLSEMDWFIADEVLLPPSYDAHFRERIWRLPRIRMAYRGDASLPNSQWRADPDGNITIGSFNNLNKVRQESLSLWAKVMTALPEARLLLKDRRASNPATQARITTELSRHGVGAERVEFITWAPDWRSHMALYDRLDIAVDTLPLNSETTAFDALWMGVPLVGLEGNWMGGRMTSTILNALEKSEWIGRNDEEYVGIVCKLARDIVGRRALRPLQRGLVASSPLCDAKDLTRSLERAFEAMFDQWSAPQ
ncbi:MAG: repeat protein [Betaproteobacteria bacterium]|nr:repeat protein [Betaproteobacteria bacterium]